MTWLVTGGAGYIGAHVVDAMRAAGEAVVVLDDLSSGVSTRLQDVPLVVGSVGDRPVVERVLREHSVRGIVHLAAKKQVEESVRRPLYYYEQNVDALRQLLQVATDLGVESFVFSSSAAVYGAPDEDRVTESSDCRPVNPYGETKLIGEWMVAAVSRATGLRYANLRYFNVAGSDAPALADVGESNLVPMVFRRLANHEPPQIFGDDYPTPDGTCVRDFIHVADIASAHVSAAQALSSGRVTALTANIGTGTGVSVRDMVQTIREVTGTAPLAWSEPLVAAARPGDPPRVVASADRIRAELDWTAQRSVHDMVASAWEGWVSQQAR
jgi:UDP-glucose 4-epimerase